MFDPGDDNVGVCRWQNSKPGGLAVDSRLGFRFVLGVVYMFLFLSLVQPAAAGTATVSVERKTGAGYETVSTTASQVGEIITIDIYARDVIDLYGVDFSLQYDQDYLQVSSLSAGEIKSLTVAKKYDNANGAVRYAASLLGSNGITGNCLLATINFKIIKTGQADINLTVVNLVDVIAQEITAVNKGLTINIPGQSQDGDTQPGTETPQAGDAEQETGSDNSQAGSDNQQTETGNTDNSQSTSEGQGSDLSSEGITGPFTPEVNLPEADFSDTSGHWASARIKSLVSLGIVKGYPDKTFKPENNITRAEFVTMICAALGLQGEKNVNFNDVTAGDWFAGNVRKAVAAGIIKGDGESFRPNDPVTRVEVAAMLGRIFNRQAISGDVLNFADAASIPGWALADVAAAKNAALITGYEDNTFRPANNATRAEAVVFISRLITK
jgi:hypothetical protein